MTGLGRVAPNFGIRFELTLSRGDAEGAEYVCVARAQHATYEGLARIAGFDDVYEDAMVYWQFDVATMIETTA